MDGHISLCLKQSLLKSQTEILEVLVAYSSLRGKNLSLNLFWDNFIPESMF